MNSVELSEEVKAKLTAFALRHNESLEAAVDHALRDYFSSQEEEERRWQETLDAAAQMDKGEGIEGEKILAWLKSWGTDNELPSP